MILRARCATISHMYDYRAPDGSVDPQKLAAVRREVAALAAPERAQWTAKLDRIEQSRGSGNPSRFAASQDGTGLVLDVFGAIGEDWFSEGFTAASVARAIRETSGTITLRVNSGGGDAFEGDAIRSLLQAAPNRIEADVLALAASAATLPLMAADEIRMAENAVLMIHNASVSTRGSVAEHESAIQLLRAVDAGAADIYARRTGRNAQEFADLMAKETWLTAKEAVSLGLADKIVLGAGVQNAAPADLSSAPEQVRVLLAHKGPATPTRMLELLKALGLAEDATEEQALAALAARDAVAAPAPVVEPAPAQAAPAAPSAAAALANENVVELAASAAVDRFIAAGVLTPAQRAKAITACGNTAASLNAAVAVWESTQAVLPAPVKPTKSPEQSTSGLTPNQERLRKQAKLTVEQFRAAQAKYHLTRRDQEIE